MIKVRSLYPDLWEPYLRPNETVLWDGHPARYRIIRTSDLWWVPLGLVLFAFMLTLEMQLLIWRSPKPIVVIGAFLVALSAYGVVGRYAHRYWTRYETYYALTNKRVLILSRMWGERIYSVPIERIPYIEHRYHRDGTGTIFVGRVVDGKALGFEDIHYSEVVAQQLERLRKHYTPYNVA